MTFTLGAGPHTITLMASALTVARNVSIVNTVSGTNGAVTVSGGGVTRVFTINSGRTAAISGLTIANGLAAGAFPANAGGGILNDHGSLTITNSTLSGNTAGLGGGIYNNGDTTAASLAIVNSTLSANSATVDGGAVYNKGIGGGAATLAVTNGTISGNTANGNGGGIYNEGNTLASAPLTVTDTTITNNRADNDTSGAGTGGGLANVTATVTLRNTIVARNFVGGSGTTADDIVGALDGTSFNNLIGDGTNMTGVTQGSNGNQVGAAGSPIDPLLGALANNGGPTFTHALLTASPAIDQGAAAADPVTTLPITTDQRGQPRPVDNQNVANAAGGNGSDIGAYEASGPPQAPDLQSASDTGLSATDNITSTTTPVFDIAGVVNGATVDLLRDGTPIATGTAVGTTIALTDPSAPVGTHVYTARQTVAGGTSPVSTGLSVTIDTTPPPVPSIDLNAASDSGISSTDNLTNAATRVFTIANTESGTLVELLRAAASVSSTAGNGGTVQLSDAAALADNPYSYTARQTDAAGNVSTSPALTVTMDSTSPTVAMTSAAPSTTSVSPIPVTVTFNESVFDFTSSDITAVNATVGNSPAAAPRTMSI